MKSPPYWIIKFIQFFVPSHLAEGIIGDIWEQYEKDQQHSKFLSQIMLIWNTIRFIRPGIIFRNKKTQIINKAMLRINFLIAFRNMIKYKLYTMINIFGLALSICFGLLVFFYTQNAFKHDLFHENPEEIYRIIRQTISKETNEIIEEGATNAHPLGPDLKSRSSNIQGITRVLSTSGVARKDGEFISETIRLVDPDFFEVFSFPIVDGNSNQPLQSLSDIIISSEMAIKYFGNKNPVGEIFEFHQRDSSSVFIVSAVADPVEDLNSLPFDFLIHFDHLDRLISDKSFLNNYNIGYIETFVRINGQASAIEVEKEFTSIYYDVAKIKEDDDQASLKLQPISDLYWASDQFRDGETINYNPDYVYILVGLSVLVLFVAIMNFIMLSSSQSLNRIKEFGVRKTMGAFKLQLSSQLILEVFVLTVLASILALFATFYILPIFNSLTDANLRFYLSFELLVFIGSIIFLISMLSGLIASGFLIKLKPTNALKGRVLTGRINWGQQSMVIAQFTLSIALIISTFIFRAQMTFINEKALGFDKEELIEVNLGNNQSSKEAQIAFDLFKSRLDQETSVISSSGVMNTLSFPWTRFSFRQEDESEIHSYFNLVTNDYLNTMNIEVVVGRSFKEDDPENVIIVNESLVRQMGWENPLEEQIPGKNFESSHQIIGVFKDFNFSSLHQEVDPLILAINPKALMEGVTGLYTFTWPPQLTNVLIRVAPGNAAETAKKIKGAWQEIKQNEPFQIEYVNTILDDHYQEEKRYSKIINYAATFSLIIAWLGLIALTRLIIQRKFKEMGIRKVLGSSSFNIMILIARRFVLLIGIATLVSWPLAWYGLNQWLQDFAYHVHLSPIWFVVAGLIVLLITFVSISIQSMRVMNVNPAETLRTE